MTLFYLLLSLFLLGKAEKPAERWNFVFIIADDLSPTLSCYGDSVIETPAIDELARQGVLFEKAFCAAPSCSPSRASILTGRYPHQLAEGVNLWGFLPKRYDNVVDMLEQSGYRVGYSQKGWGPGKHEAGNYDRNPAGPAFPSLENFLSGASQNQPFFYWLGPHDPHRVYDPRLKEQMNLNADRVKVPGYLPDVPEVREDLLDYYAEAARFEQTVSQTIELIKKNGHWERTIIFVTSDNGMPFPRAKANLYDAGAHIPLVIYGGPFQKGLRVQTPVNLIDIAPTLLEQAGLPKSPGMQGRSLSSYLRQPNAGGTVFLERERHAYVRANNASYPSRAIRTEEYLYIQNLRPERWPAGDPEHVFAVGPYGDVDEGPSKTFLQNKRENPAYQNLFMLAFGKRPAEELYDLRTDPWQLNNLADQPEYKSIKKNLSRRLQSWRKKTQDPRLKPEGEAFEGYPYFGDATVRK